MKIATKISSQPSNFFCGGVWESRLIDFSTALYFCSKLSRKLFHINALEFEILLSSAQAVRSNCNLRS